MFHLQTKRLRFRNYTNADFYFLKGLLQSKDMMRYIGDGQTRNDAEVEQFLSWIYTHYREDEHTGLKIIENRKTGEPMGHAGIVPQVMNGQKQFEIGYWVAKAYWGQGFATEAAEAMKDYAEQEMHLTNLIALIQPGNKASMRIAETIGMHLNKTEMLNGQEVHVFTTKA